MKTKKIFKKIFKNDDDDILYNYQFQEAVVKIYQNL